MKLRVLSWLLDKFYRLEEHHRHPQWWCGPENRLVIWIEDRADEEVGWVSPHRKR